MWIADDPENLARVYRALAKFGAPKHVLQDLAQLAPDEILYMGNPPVRVDILQEVSGLDYAAAFSRRIQIQWHGVTVAMVSLEDLIASKRAAGRPQDLLDAQNLERVRSGDPGDAEF